MRLRGLAAIAIAIVMAGCGDDSAAVDAGRGGTDAGPRRDSGGGGIDGGGGGVDGGPGADGGGDGSVGATGALIGRVFSVADGKPLSGAVVIGPGDVMTTTDAEGDFMLMEVPVGTQAVFRFSADGYAPTQELIDVEEGGMSYLEAFVPPVGTTGMVDASGGGRVAIPESGATADFPASAFVDAMGMPVTGMVEVELTNLDPTDPLSLRAFPGAFEGRAMDGTMTSIETYGPMEVTVRQGDDELQLAADTNAVLTFPIHVPDSPQTIALWSLDEATGMWVQEGTATKVQIDGAFFYRAEIAHMSWWNPDRAIERSCVTACVTRGDTAVPGATVTVEGVGFGYAGRGRTDAEGCAEMRIRRDRQNQVSAMAPGVSSVAVLVTGNAPETDCSQRVDLTLETVPLDCPAGTEECNNQCVVTSSDPNNCGGCGNTCFIPGSVCIAGTCGCPAGTLDCGGQCVATDFNRANCGACGNSCAGGEICTDGSCVSLGCGTDLIRCGTSCVDSDSDRANCGGCGGGSGDVGVGCEPGLCTECGGIRCGGICRFVQFDRNNCGGCGVTCATGQQCQSGSCQPIVCDAGELLCGNRCVDGEECGEVCETGTFCGAGSCMMITCGGGETLCGNECVDTSDDVANCGACGTMCLGGQVCAGGGCACPAGGTDCGGPGEPLCVDTSTDRNNCGGCDMPCATGQECTGGTCSAIVCGAGTELCGNECVDTSTSATQCGGCTLAGSAPGGDTGGGISCERGFCPCPSGQIECEFPGSSGTVGYCVDTATDDQNCGGCGAACPSGQECSAGSCVGITCPAGQTLCDGVCIFGGSCGTVCPEGGTCSAGTCACPAGMTDICDGSCVDVQSDADHCGSCGAGCDDGEVCNAGVCGLEPCAAGEIRCGTRCTDITTDGSNCGGCAPGDATFGYFGCGPAPCCADEGLSRCNITGLGEVCVDLDDDPRNCGTCNNNCGVGSECNSGTCQAIVCPAGQTLCGSTCVNGTTCGVRCDEGVSCTMGTCG